MTPTGSAWRNGWSPARSAEQHALVQPGQERRGVVVDRDGAGLGQLRRADAAGEHRDRADAGLGGGVDVPDRVADEDRVLRCRAGLVERGEHRLRVGLGRLDVFAGDDAGDDVIDVEDLPQHLELVRCRRGGQHHPQPAPGQLADEVGGLVERPEQFGRLQVEAAVQLLRLVADAAGVFVAQQGAQQLAGPLADRAVHVPRVHGPVQRVERPAPGVDVEVVGIDERAVDVEQDRGGDGSLLCRCGFPVLGTGNGRVVRIPRCGGKYT
ncbi:hypothetical protein DV20_21800 [Amycolatopsis rifamycinica]|uniref:Uncharacterized protein n=1 Tax=Amycolatopsis rifamycinica TaxID=287986 RepID=A0A066TZ62_9PSEU|nr:hypothetical protein DV20_21800 [Amycolatopsis rifamycinica]